ncbi:MAG: hypothetical protein LKI99_06260 [Acetobacter fabarum]|nr:hypothetical protein [Acetobacter fabarum]MCI1909300.1 hypothetical protein [Acetobacter fabarum]MCI1927278.1 hypothetical protein [Acetobacter fabarum]MCI1947278.1 hypothetical protein [Acetobacter fabarum]MCI1988469.1 hypothetical protein [Acetobacter fabarum]
MAYYTEDDAVQKISDLDDLDFIHIHDINTDAPKAGIYRCSACQHEIAIAKGHNLPPDNSGGHPKHGSDNDDHYYYWSLIVKARHIHD